MGNALSPLIQAGITELDQQTQRGRHRGAMSASVACNGQNALLHSANQIEFDLTIIPLAPFRQADMVKNMASDVYLYRKDRRWQKASKVIDVTMTSNQTAYAGITGVASTNIVTVTGATLADGQILTLSAKTGGSGLSLGVGYYIINASGAAGQLSLTPGGSVVALSTNISAGAGIVSQPELSVWSSEYRDIFGNTTDLFAGLGIDTPTGVPYVGTSTFSASAAVIPSDFTGGGVTSTLATSIGGLSVRGTSDLSIAISDEISHHPLRQNFLKKSFWKFDRGASSIPRYLYAEYMQGDQILDNPPETV